MFVCGAVVGGVCCLWIGCCGLRIWRVRGSERVGVGGECGGGS